MATLATADQRVIVPDGVGTLTAVPSRSSLAAYVVGSVGAVTCVSAAAFVATRWISVVLLGALAAGAVVAGALVVDRRYRARREWPHHAGSWLLCDVAAVPGVGGGDRILGDVARRADAARMEVVLRARRSADHAMRLYEAHGFDVVEMSDTWARMRRLPHLPALHRQHRRWILAVGMTMAAIVVALSWPSPLTWLVLPVGALLTAGAIVDIEQRRVPNALIGAGFALLLIAIVALQLETGAGLVGPAVVGAALFAGPLLLVHVVTATRTPGLGDVKLAAKAGLVCGAYDVRLALPAVATSCLIGCIFGMVWQRKTGQRVFPFAPAIALGTAMAIGFGALAGWGAL